MRKNTIRLNESQLRQIVKESVKKVLKEDIASNSTYVVRGFHYEMEEDIYKEGLNGKSYSNHLDYTFSGNSIGDVVNEVMNYLGIDSNNFGMVIDTTYNRLQINFMCDGRMGIPSEEEYNRWKQGYFTLYMCTIFLTIEQIAEVTNEELQEQFPNAEVTD